MSNEQTQIQPFVKASTQLGHLLGMETSALLDALKSQFFKNISPDKVSDAQLATVISVANALKLNPLLPGQLYPYPERSGGVTVMIGPDGIFTLLANNPDIVAGKDGGAAWWTEHGKDGDKETCTAYINHRTKGLLKKTIWIDEWVVSSNPNWNARRHHMAETRALKQCARMVVHGIPVDSDEHAIAEINVTPQLDAPARPPAPPREKKGAAAVKENLTPAIDAKAEIVPDKPSAAAVESKTEQPQKAAPSTPSPKDGQAAAAAQATPVTPRTSLADGDKFTAKVEIVEFTAKIAKVGGLDTPVVHAIVRGEYEGKIVHINGAKLEDGKVVAPAAWQIERPVIVELFGKLNKVTNQPVTQVYSIRELDAKPDPIPDEY